jgi:hypothetical protein
MSSEDPMRWSLVSCLKDPTEQNPINQRDTMCGRCIVKKKQYARLRWDCGAGKPQREHKLVHRSKLPYVIRILTVWRPRLVQGPLFDAANPS